LTARPDSAETICTALNKAGIPCAQIGRVEAGQGVWDVKNGKLNRPERDEITKVFEA
jgi:hypothetical protein